MTSPSPLANRSRHHTGNACKTALYGDGGNRTRATFPAGRWRAWLLGVATACAAAAHPGPADAHVRGCNTKACDKRVKRACFKSSTCRARVVRKRLAREMRRYKAHPLPWCTWGPESGRGRGEWSMARYRQPAIGQGPRAGGGKFQIIDSTWENIGGLRFGVHAYNARPVFQERLARVIASWGISSQWVNC